MEEGLLPSLLKHKFSLTSTPLVGRFLVGLAVGILTTVNSLRSLLHLGAASLICILIGCCFTSLHLRYTAGLVNNKSGQQLRIRWNILTKKVSTWWMSCCTLFTKNKEECGPLLDLEDAEDLIYNSQGNYLSEASVSDSEDADIDTIVREYQISTISRQRSAPKNILAYPSGKSALIVLISVSLLVVSFSSQIILLSLYPNSLEIWTGSLTSCSLVSLFLMSLISQQPMTILSRQTPSVGNPWVQCLALCCLITLLYPLLLSLPIIFIWYVLGAAIYIMYSVNHSTLGMLPPPIPPTPGIQTLTLANLAAA